MLYLLFACAGPAVAQNSLNLSVVGTTPTQAILQYTAATSAACAIEASESPSFFPPVHDVNPNLFPQSNMDTRPGNLVAGQARVVVIGKRSAEAAANQNNYSRALQANTAHYFRVNCGGTIATVSATTATIAAGIAYNDGPQVDPDHPGQWTMPTRLEDRSQTIVDPQTGALLHAVSLDAESKRANGFNGIFMLYGGFVRMCAPKLVGPAGGPLGFICSLVRYGQGGYVAYWIVPSTGEVRMLGNLPLSGGGPFGPLGSDLRSFGPDNSGNTVWVDYTGNFMPSVELPTSGWHQYSSIPTGQLMKQFDPAFDPAKFTCEQPWAEAGAYKLFKCGTGQDNPGWLGVLYGGDGRAIVPGCTDGDACPRIVAAADIFNIDATRWCGLHNVQQMDDVASINVQTVGGVPRCVAMGHMVYWRFKTDPHGTALVVDNFFDGGGHWDHGPMGRISETGSGWGAVVGAPPAEHLNEPYSVSVEDSPFFAGARGLSWGSTTSKHPSYHQVAGVAPASESGWLLDMVPFDGGQFYSPPEGATPLSGQLYKYNHSTEQSSAKLARKQLPTLAASGGRALIDISGPASTIGDTAADSFKYCVALVAGECRPGSAPGDTFVNAPGVQFTRCLASDGPNPQNFDLCIGNMGAYHQGLVQADLTGTARPRVITYGMAGIRNSFYFSTAKSLPDGSWALFPWGVVQPGFGDLTNVWMAKMPPLVDDHVDRSTFLPLTLNLTPPAGAGVARAIVQFGYAEQGSPTKYYCTSRREACVAASSSLNVADPFRYANTESYSGVACATSCQITVPVLPSHTVYYQAIYLDASGHVVSTGIRGASAELAKASVGAEDVVTTAGPPAPTGLTGVSTSTQINLSWTSGGGTTAGFKVYRNGSLIGSVASAAYADGNLSPSTSYSYTVYAFDAIGNMASMTNPAGPVTVTTLPGVTVSVTPHPVTLTPGGTQAFTATVGGTSNQAVTWSLGSQVGSISVSGVYTAPSNIVSTTSLVIIATSVADPLVSNSAVVTIQPLAPVTVSVTPHPVTLAPGGTQAFTATVGGTSNQAVTWSLGSQVGSISASGVYTAPSNIVSTTSLVIIATSVADPSVSNSAVVTIQPPGPVTVRVTPHPVTLAPGGSQAFTATVGGTSNQAVTWSMGSQVGSISASGVYTAPSNITSTTSLAIIATSVADPSVSNSALMIIEPPPAASLVSVTLAGGSATGGQSVQGTFTLSGAAGAIAGPASITCSDPSVIVSPASIMLTATSTGGSFSVATKPVTAAVNLTVSVTYNGVTKSTGLTVNPPALASVTPATSTVTGGTAVALQFSLTGPAAAGASISIGSSNVTAIPPAGIPLTAGQSSGTLSIPTNPVAATAVVTLSLSSGGVTQTVTVTVNSPAPPALASVTPASATVTGGTAVALQFSLTGPAAAGASISIGSSNVTAIPSAGIPLTAGQSSGTLSIPTNPVAASTVVTLSLSSGGVTQTVTVTVNPPAPPALASVTPASATVTGGTAVALQFTLTAPAVSGTTIAIVSGNTAAVPAPASVPVTAGQSSGTLSIPTNPVVVSTALTLSLSSGGATKTVTVTVNPPALLPLSNISVKGGTSFITTASLAAAAAAGTSITLSSSNPAVAAVSPSVAVPAGASSVSFTTNTSVVATNTTVNVSVSYAGVTQVMSVTVLPASGTCPAAPTGAFMGCYYAGTELSGTPRMTRIDKSIDFDWGRTPPSPTLQGSKYSVRWQGNFSFAGGEYTFDATTSDGMRIYIDGNLVLDRWMDQAATMYRVRQSLSPGTHLIKVEYYDHGNGATAHVSWTQN